ncbi:MULTISPECIES: hypothetical protein [unclassified Neptuniibacter]|jgi:hypothetical protein|uniref:hypothetical protein n=1 Tax=unclassified Neptuniibacter TaxID=2630693 RepID=UPI000C4A801E|nr:MULTISPECIES: hypothetical protein [unclassified Neptuniibacter]MAY43516.1 hypothetical protein [Oceanospirillaceae bacterium]|tara:strand:+ start:5519 stop:5800 length:282 start_codon:yes stop_codon:yes gene_type:complete
MSVLDYTELHMETELLWNEIDIGDSVMLDADLYESNRCKLHKYQAYEVVAKVHCMAPEPSRLVVESDVTGEFIKLHPALLCSYQSAENPISRA